LIKITKRISFYEIEFDKLQEVVPLLDKLSYTQYKSDDAIPYGYLLSTKNKRVRVPIGVGDFEVRKRLKNVVSFEYDDACIPSKPSTGYTFKAEAFDQLGYDNLSHFALENLINFIDNYLGLTIKNTTPDITETDREKLRARFDAKENKNFEKADQIRESLSDDGIQLNDLSDRTIWNRQ
jgi:hypothetical protein